MDLLILTATLALLFYALRRIARDSRACVTCSGPADKGNAECAACERTR